jgi:phospholipase C
MNDPIEHVVVLMLENHSFDQMLGSLSAVYNDLDGVDPKKLRRNPDYPDATHFIFQSETNLTSISLDPAHEFVNVNHQLANGGTGFVRDYVQANPNCTDDEKAQIMAYYPLDFLPILHKLARNFTVCDRWFSSMPGPTWPNRFFVHSGTCKGHVKMPSGIFDANWHCYDQTTLYDRLCEQNISWKIYHDGEAQTLVMVHQLLHFEHYHDMEKFFEDTDPENDPDPANFPQFTFIEPCYSGKGQNDQHPPTDIMKGELLLAKVYNALRKNEALWKTTLLVVVYDEHGGFYDHVTPGPTVAPDDNTDEFNFDSLGVRVPAILVSPWTDPRVDHTVYDHTSLLKYLTDKWGLGPLGVRTAQANSFGPQLVMRTSARTDTPPQFTDALLGPLELPNPQVNENQKALVSFSQVLEKKMSDVEDFAAIGSRSLRMLSGPQAQFAVAKDRFERYLQYGKEGKLKADPNPGMTVAKT